MELVVYYYKLEKKSLFVCVVMLRGKMALFYQVAGFQWIIGQGYFFIHQFIKYL